MKPGTFLVFEGLDGSGKSTQLERLAERLRTQSAEGVEVVTTGEPWSGSPWGERIRAMARAGAPLPPDEELRWFLYQRRDHVRELIRPALAEGKIVLSDRYYLSTVAYQGARGLDADAILRESEAEFPVPDLVLLLEVEPGEGLRRAGRRGDPHEPVFEQRDFLERAARVFHELDRDYVERVDASCDPDAVHAAILAALRRRGLLEEAEL